jgi:hypothetical protein
MRRFCLAAAGLAVAALAPAIPAFAQVPALPFERTCKSATPLDAQDTQPVESCLRDERAARADLERQWAKFDEKSRRLCLEQTNIGGFPSYVDVLTCLEMAAASGAPERRRRRFGS